MPAKRKHDIDRLRQNRPAPLPPKPQFYTETTRTFVQRSADAVLEETQERRRVPVSPQKRGVRDQSHGSQSRSPSPIAAHMDVDRGETDDSLPGLVDSDEEGDSRDKGDSRLQNDDDEDDEDTEDEDDDAEDTPRAARASVRAYHFLNDYSLTLLAGSSVPAMDPPHTSISRRATSPRGTRDD